MSGPRIALVTPFSPATGGGGYCGRRNIDYLNQCFGLQPAAVGSQT